MILGQFVSVGVIALVIIFQPEIRKFLLVLGNNAVKGNIPFFNGRFFRIMKAPLEESPMVAQLHSSMLRMAKERVGALIVLAEDLNFPGLEDSGILINAEVTKQLIVSIFNKESPLHDGAMVIYNMKIYKAGILGNGIISKFNVYLDYVNSKVKESAPSTQPKAPETVQMDDLTIVEGIGPKVQELFNAHDIHTYAQLAATDIADLKKILDNQGGTYQAMDPGTWPKQAGMAAEGKMDELKAWQDEMQGGRSEA